MKILLTTVFCVFAFVACKTEQDGDVPTTKKIVEEIKNPTPKKVGPKPVLVAKERISKADKNMGQQAPFSTTNKIVQYTREFNVTEYSQIQLGLVPENEWDRWLIVFSGDTLNFFRDNTRYCLFQVVVEPLEKGGRVVEARVNKNIHQFITYDDQFDKSLLAYLFERILLGHAAECPVPSNTAEEDIEEAILKVSGYGRANTEELTWPNGKPEQKE